MTCDGRIGYVRRDDGWGFRPLHCTQTVGLRVLRDATGRSRHYCSRHRADVARRYGEMADPESCWLCRASLADGCYVNVSIDGDIHAICDPCVEKADEGADLIEHMDLNREGDPAFNGAFNAG